MWPEVAGRAEPVTWTVENSLCAAFSILVAFGLVSDRVSQDGFGLREEADGKAATVLCP